MSEIYDAVGELDGREVRRYWIDGKSYWLWRIDGAQVSPVLADNNDMAKEFDYFDWLEPADPDPAPCDHCDCWNDHRATCCDCGVSE